MGYVTAIMMAQSNKAAHPNIPFFSGDTHGKVNPLDIWRLFHNCRDIRVIFYTVLEY